MQKNIRMVSGHIQKLIAEGEHQMLDFKFEISDCKKIARSLVAFANTDGGRLLIGVKDNGTISGIRSEEEKHMIQTAAELYCKPAVEFSAKEWNINGKNVLEVIIPKSQHHKHKAPDHNNIYKVYVRVKDENIIANSILIKVWKHENDKSFVKITFSEEEKMLLKYLEENKTISFDEFLEISHLKKRAAENIFINFILIGMIKMEMSEKKISFKYCDLA
ncbi:MAG: ATP-binding protein [Bacteroidales bacterium]|nr:ATP-binding protein [Bacteroidales bacterium]